MKTKLGIVKPPPPGSKPQVSQPRLPDVCELIRTARETIARGVNAALVMLCWRIGQHIRTDILGAKRAEYGDEISEALILELGAGFAFLARQRRIQTGCQGGDLRASLAHSARGLSEFYLLPARHAVRPRAGLFFPHA